MAAVCLSTGMDRTAEIQVAQRPGTEVTCSGWDPVRRSSLLIHSRVTGTHQAPAAYSLAVPWPLPWGLPTREPFC